MDTAEFNRKMLAKKEIITGYPSRMNDIHGYTIVKKNVSPPSELEHRGLDKETGEWLIGIRELARRNGDEND